MLLGIVIAGLVYGLNGSVLAGTEMRRSLATALRSLAGLSRVGLHGDPTAATIAPARGWRWKVYQDLTTTLRLLDESKLDRGAGAELDRVEMEDEAIIESVQRGVRSRYYDRGRYSPSREQGVHHFHRLLGEMLEGATKG